MQTKDIYTHWGTEFTDISDLFSQDVVELRKLLYQRKMLVFHAPDWKEIEYWRFLALWGEPWTKDEYIKSTERWKPVVDSEAGQIRYITWMSNKLSKRLQDFAMPWHADIANRVTGINFPHRCIYMKTVPNPAAGFTYWLDMELAYPEIHPRLRARWESKTVVQQNWHHPGRDIVHVGAMKQHPITGRWSPRCNYHGVSDSWIVDILDSSGNSYGTGIVEELMEAMSEIKDCVFEMRWQPNDIVLYDNWPFVHRRTSPELKEGEERLMWRANIDHDPNIGALLDQGSSSVSQ